MKKLILTITTAILTTSAISAFSLENNHSKNFREIVAIITHNDFKEITLKELPDAVVDSILEDFAAAIVTEVYVNDQHQYKIKFIIDDQTKSFVYADEKGNWLNKRKVKDL